MRSAAVLLIPLSLGVLAAPAGATATPGLVVQPTDVGVWDEPTLRAAPVNGPTGLLGPPRWERCSGDPEVCVDIAPDPIHPFTAFPGPTVPGTTFRVTLDSDHGPLVGRSPVWGGPVVRTSPPVIVGPVEVGGTVQVRSGTVAGGWRDYEGDASPDTRGEVVACPSASSLDGCEWFENWGLSARHAGWYIRRVEYIAGRMRLGGRAPILEPIPVDASWITGFGSLSAVSEPAGPVCCVPPPQTLESRADTAVPLPPSATIRARAYRRAGRLVIGSVRCAVPCTVRLTVQRRGGRPIRRTLRAQGARTLKIPVQRGRLRVRVAVDGKVLASGRTRY